VELVKERTKYYQYAIRSILESVGADISKLKFVLGSDYQEGAKYVRDLLRMSTIVSANQATKAGAEIVKQSADAPLSCLIYPLMQVLGKEPTGE
jgi:tyrosyl-tRNA synthetase